MRNCLSWNGSSRLDLAFSAYIPEPAVLVARVCVSWVGIIWWRGAGVGAQAGLEGYHSDNWLPTFPQVLFEALISPDHKGYIGLDDILLFSYPCGESLSTPTQG